MRPVSRELRIDPTQTKNLRLAYEKELLRLIRRMRPAWYLLVEKAHEMLNQQRGEEFDKLVFRVFNEQFVDPAKRVAKTHTMRTYLAGQAKAKAQLKSIGIGANIGALPPDPRVLDILNTRNYGAMKGIADELAKRIKSSLTESVMLGESMEQSAKRIRSETATQIKRSRLIARTETMFAFNTAQVEEYRRYGIEKVEWLTAGPGASLTGKKRCDECAKNDGKVFDIDKHPPCPLHPNCRCTLLAVPEEL